MKKYWCWIFLLCTLGIYFWLAADISENLKRLIKKSFKKKIQRNTLKGRLDRIF